MEEKRQPMVSVIMATFNRGSIIGQTIANILEQDYPFLELIVINDASSDDTQAILQSFEATQQIVLINNKQNLGLQRSLNKGLQKAKGNYIARIDDHDEWIRTDKISKQVHFLEQHPTVGMLGTAYQVGTKTQVNRLTDQAIRQQMLFRCPFCHVTVLIRKSILDRVGGYDETLRYSEDWELWLRIGTQTQLANLPDITTRVKEDEGSLSDQFVVKQLPINLHIITKYLKHYPNRKKAILYHHFIKYFFACFPLNGKVHRSMQKVFRLVFLNGER